MNYIGGWLRSSGNVGVAEFKRNSEIIKLGSPQLNEHIIPEYTPISNQGSLGSCVANASCDCLEILIGLKDSAKVEQLSRLFLYWNSRLYHQATDQDKGTYIHLAMKSLETHGVCRESTWAYKISNVFAQPNILSYKEGNDNILHSYRQITSFGEERLRDIEASIKKDCPVVFGTLVDKNFTSGNLGAVVDKPTGNIVGGHAMIITGVRKNSVGELEFYIRNSWGNSWGINGHVWMSADYLAWDETSDLFVGTMFDGLI